MGLCNVVRCTDCGYERLGFPVADGMAVLVCPNCGSAPELPEWWNNTKEARLANERAKAAWTKNKELRE